MRGDLLDDGFGLGEACGADPMGAARGQTNAGVTSEGTLGAGELFELFGRDEKDAAFGFDVATVRGGGGEELVLGDFAGAEGDGDVEAIAVVDGIADDFGGDDAGGVLFEIGRELGAKFVAQAVAVRGEKVERLVPIAQPPFAVGRFEREASGFDQLERGSVGDVLA